MVHAQDASTGEVDGGRLGVQGQPRTLKGGNASF